MRVVLPGKPRPGLQTLCTGYWNGTRLLAYITGNAFAVLGSPQTVLQTIYDDDDAPLESIALEEGTGKIATSSGRIVRVYRPYGQEDGELKWSLQSLISLDDHLLPVSTLSWGSSEELVVGSSYLSLFNTQNEALLVWQKQLANAPKFAEFSYDSGFVASTGHYDRLVQIWRRLSFGSEDVRFDFSFLPHPQAVTSLKWRRPYHLDQTIENVLYTICFDNVVRIWAASDQQSVQILQLWRKIDLRESIQPRSPTSRQFSAVRFAFIIDGRDFRMATEFTVQQTGSHGSNQDHSVDHLIEVANRSPEICVVLDEFGYMSAWALENIGRKDSEASGVFNIAHVSGIELKSLSKGNAMAENRFCQLYNYCSHADGKLNLLIHHNDGIIECFEAHVACLFDPAPRQNRIMSGVLLMGHSDPVKKIVRNSSGHAIVSHTVADETIVWQHKHAAQTGLRRKSTIQSVKAIHRTCILHKGDFIVLLHNGSIDLWDCRASKSCLVASLPYNRPGKALCILVLPGTNGESSVTHIATITSMMEGTVWQLNFPAKSQPFSKKIEAVLASSIQEFCTFNLESTDNLSYIRPIDPTGSLPVVTGFLDMFTRDVAISYTSSGLLQTWATKIDTDLQAIKWLATSSVETGIFQPALVSGSSSKKVALVNSQHSELTIWDVRGMLLEYTHSIASQDFIRNLDWTSTPDGQSVLALGLQHRVILLSQMRFDYLDRSPAWAIISEINIRDLTSSPIGDSTWLEGGGLVIGAGNQLFVYDRHVLDQTFLKSNLRLPHNEGEYSDLFQIVGILNGPLPIFHPQFLSQCILAGKLELVLQILQKLHIVLVDFSEQIYLDNLLGMELEEFYDDIQVRLMPGGVGKLRGATALVSDSIDSEIELFTEGSAHDLTDKLSRLEIPQLSAKEQIHLVGIIECILFVEKHRQSVDENAAKFMLFFKQQMLERNSPRGTSVSWREINWALHSNSQDILIEMVTRHYQGKLSWEDARRSGLFMWISDPNAIRSSFENVARSEYSKSDSRNPADCSLFYLALKKKSVLQGLWRMAGWNREQEATTKLLSNNFKDPRWRTAALKNAYALLGKHRYEYAAAFFLLADSLKDAVNVCVNQLRDLQLAVAITRIYEGDDGPVLKELLEEVFLPMASSEGNRWLASWAFWTLNKPRIAVQALVFPTHEFLHVPPTSNMISKSFATDDPALIVLYSQLRQRIPPSFHETSLISPKEEWAFIVRSAHLYDRMGCDLLALDLVRNWKFFSNFQLSQNTIFDSALPTSLQKHNSHTAADLGVSSTSPHHSNPGRRDRTMPTEFHEPETNSLLDDFGF